MYVSFATSVLDYDDALMSKRAEKKFIIILTEQGNKRDFLSDQHLHQCFFLYKTDFSTKKISDRY